MWIQAERTGEHPQIMCSVFKETTVSVSSPPPQFHQRQHAMMIGEWAAGGGSVSEVQVWAPLLANRVILGKFLAFQVSVSLFVK